MTALIHSLEHNSQSVLSEMVNFQCNMAQQDSLMQNLIQYFVQLENGKTQSSCPFSHEDIDTGDWTPCVPLSLSGKKKRTRARNSCTPRTGLSLPLRLSTSWGACTLRWTSPEHHLRRSCRSLIAPTLQACNSMALR